MHTCPECEMACSCSGDIEDHDTGDEFYVECSHDCMEYYDDDGPWMDDEDDPPKQPASPELRQVLADALEACSTPPGDAPTRDAIARQVAPGARVARIPAALGPARNHPCEGCMTDAQRQVFKAEGEQ